MKSSSDPRHQQRIALMQELFSYSFENTPVELSKNEIATVLPGIDSQIQASALEWPLPKISKVDLAVLRLAVWELTVQKTEPPKVIIDEAVELAKEFGNESSPQFVNGVLGTILKNIDGIASSKTPRNDTKL